MKIDTTLVTRVADLASLELHAADAEALAAQLTRIVEHFEALRAVPEDLLEAGLEPRTIPFRDDHPVDCDLGSVLEANAPEMAHGHFVVPRVVTRSE